MSARRKLTISACLLLAMVAGITGLTNAHTITGTATSAEQPGWVLSNGIIAAYEVDVHPGDVYVVDSTPIATAIIDDVGQFTLTFPWAFVSGPPIPPDYESGDPDLIFLITQNTGAVETVYEELPTELHPNVASGTALVLEIPSGAAVFVNPALTPGSVPNDHLFLFTRIGNLPTADIDCVPWMGMSTGYYRARAQGYSGTESDVPFGRTLDLFGWFGQLTNVDYYQVRYSTDGGSTWEYVSTNLPNKWYDTSALSSYDWKWVSQSMGPFSDGGLNNLYVVPHFFDPDPADGVPAGSYPWTYLDRIARFSSTLVPDGTCLITIDAYEWSGSALIPATSVTVDPNYGEIKLRIDNTAPVVQIDSLELNGMELAPCAMLTFRTSASDWIGVEITAWDANGHLSSYSLSAQYGHSQAVASPPASASSNYGAQPGQSWQGCDPCTVTYYGNLYSTTAMPDCAYQFRLEVWRRVTNGFTKHGAKKEFNKHITILHPGTAYQPPPP